MGSIGLDWRENKYLYQKLKYNQSPNQRFGGPNCISTKTFYYQRINYENNLTWIPDLRLGLEKFENRRENADLGNENIVKSYMASPRFLKVNKNT